MNYRFLRNRQLHLAVQNALLRGVKTTHEGAMLLDSWLSLSDRKCPQTCTAVLMLQLVHIENL